MCSNYGGFCKKEWVGLTNEDEMILVEEARKVPNEIPCPDYNERLIRLTESKLKERNT
jgi:hypothetical protein